MNSKEACLKLLAAESEEAVTEIIEAVPELNNPANWKPLDGRETNFNVTSNQASDGGKALTELMTNMVDAVLMKHAFLKNLDPRGKDAPRTMYEAVDRLVKNLRGGKLTNLDSKDQWLREFAQKNLVIGITGAKTKREGLPCYTFVDNGEGQQAEDFENTFLSLSAGNKKKIPFVQGKYNMGSSGVLRYCGMQGYKLIVSRRYDKGSDWAWTLVRKRPSSGEEMPVAEYFFPDGETIPTFGMDMLFPFHTSEGDPYDGVLLNAGTVVKLFDYHVGSQFLSFRGARETLNENLVETILPFRLLDFRQLPKTAKAKAAAKKRGGDRAKGIDPRPFYGMEFLLLRSHREEGTEDEEDEAAGEDKIFVGKINEPSLGEVSISAIPLKRKLPDWLKKSNNRVFHAANGQVQFKQTRGYLSQSCGLPALKDRIVIIVDASRLTFVAHNEVWKGDREHISNTILGERYKELVTATIKESEALKSLQHKIAEEELDRAAKSGSNDLFQKLVNFDRNFAGLLSNRDPLIKLPSSGEGNGADRGGGEFKDGKYSPTFVRLDERFTRDGLDVPLNRTRQVSARTDAENGYLNRSDNAGRVLIDDAIRERFVLREHMHDGRLSLYLKPIEERLDVGDIFEFKVGLQDDAMPEPVETALMIIRIVDEGDEARQKKSRQKPQAGREGDKPGEGEDAPTLGLPRFILLTRDGRTLKDGEETVSWPEDFNESDGGLIEDLGENEVIYKINYDNSYHLKYRMQQRGDIARNAVTEKYVLGMRILMLGYEHALRSAQSAGNGRGEDIATVADDIRRMAARGAASTVLALAENLPKIVDLTDQTAE